MASQRTSSSSNGKGNVAPDRGQPGVLRLVIYTRYSSDMQRAESCADQERKIRENLDRLGIDHSTAVVLKDEAISGKTEVRGGFDEIKRMMTAGQVRLLAVDEQSRLGRDDFVKTFIHDLVYYGGRVLSFYEGIDTNEAGWENRVRFASMHHSMSSEELARRCRRGLEGRLLTPVGSAGDLPYGYRSEYEEANWQEMLERRQRPRKRVVVDDDQAAVVAQIFNWFAIQGWSINAIARELNRRKVPKGRRSRRPTWRHTAVRYMLKNKKYIGIWEWGLSEIVRGSGNKQRRQKAQRNQPLRMERPELRILPQELWEKAQARRREAEQFIAKHRHRHPAPQLLTGQIFRGSNVADLIRCERCQRFMAVTTLADKKRYLLCKNTGNGDCTFRRNISLEATEQAVLGHLAKLCRQSSAWVTEVYRAVLDTLESQADTVPRQLEQALERQAALKRQIDNLVGQVAEGAPGSRSIMARLGELESEAEQVAAETSQLEQRAQQPKQMPTEAWVREQLEDLPRRFAEPSPHAAQLMKQIFSPIDMVELDPVVGKRGIVQVRGRIQAKDLFLIALGDGAPAGHAGDEADDPDDFGRFVLDLTKPSRMARWAPKIAQMRAEGTPWKAIAKATGLSLGKVQQAHKEWISRQST